MAQTIERPALRSVDAATVREWQEEGSILLVDVREPREYAGGHIPGSLSMPLSRFRPDDIPDPAGRHLVLHCHAGSRARQAAEQLVAAGREVWCFEAGMSGWQAAGYPVESTASEPISVLRQTQLTVGALTLTGAVLGLLVHPGWLVLPVFMGCGLIFAGASGKCALANLIATMPWNQNCGPECRAAH